MRHRPPGAAQRRRRIVLEANGFVALAPFAPRFPFETWILPTRHRSAFEETGRRRAARAGRACWASSCAGWTACSSDPPFNFMLHTAPLREGRSTTSTGTWRSSPSSPSVAGYEWGSGFFINPVPPEDAAAALREAAG